MAFACCALWHFITGGEHQMAAVNTLSSYCGGSDATPLCLDADDLDGREDTCAVLRNGIEQRERRRTRVDRKVAVAHQRGRCGNVETRTEFVAVEEAARQAGRAPDVVLADQAVAIKHGTGEIKRIPGCDTGDAEFRKAGRQRVHREPRAPPGALGVPLADLARQLDEWSVDLVKRQRRAGGGRTP